MFTMILYVFLLFVANKLSLSPVVTQIYFIDNQLTQLADRLSIQRTGHDVRRVSPSDRTTVMYLIHSPQGRI